MQTPHPFSFAAEDLARQEDWLYEELAVMRERLLATDTGRIWRDIPNGHKWLGYFEIYDALFTPFRNRRPKVLEIGVDRGGSMELWRRFFGAGCTIVGLDINPDCRQFDNPAAGSFVRVGSATDDGFTHAVLAEFGPFDIIIDDGSHKASDQIASFNLLFGAALTNRGLYVVEDLESAFWGQRTGQADMPITFMDFVKSILDQMHQPFQQHDYGYFLIQNEGERAAKPLIVSRVAKLVFEIRFFRQIVCIQKKTVAPPIVQHLL